MVFVRKIAILTMDIEDWYHLDYFRDISCDTSFSMLDGVDHFKDILDAWGIKATFFVLGEIAEQIKTTLRNLSDQGHEIASHGWSHKKPLTMTAKEFQLAALQSLNEISGAIGEDVLGYRAACFSMDRTRLNILPEVGYLYDSSLIDFSAHSLYGKIDMTGFYESQAGIYIKEKFIEFEVSTTKVLGQKLPVSGGGYLRILPWNITKKLLQKFIASQKIYVFYIHPFELSTQSIKFSQIPAGSLINKVRFSAGQKSVANKLNTLIGFLKKNGFDFTTFRELYSSQLNSTDFNIKL